MAKWVLRATLVALMHAACTPGREQPAANATPGTAEAAVDLATPAPGIESQPGPSMSTASREAPASTPPATASIAGSIRDGNRPPPALRVCATPVDGGAATCIDTTTGARQYRIEMAPGRYYLLGWVAAGELALIAHAAQVRCIQAPCPPDELIEVEVGVGERREGIDLDGGYADVPAGWPQRPA